MGESLSSCCMSSPSSKLDVPMDEINQLHQLQQRIIQENDDDSTEILLHRIYDLIVDNQCDLLQQAIYTHEIDLSTILWKNMLTPLHVAAMKGHLKMTQMLLINGLNPNAVDKLGRTPLHWAARNRHTEVYEFLKPLTKNPSLRDIYGISADSFYSDETSPDVSIGIASPPMSPLSLSSLTLHTISLSTEHSLEQNQLSPRVLDVSLQPQFHSGSLSPKMMIGPLRSFSTSPQSFINIPGQSSFLIEEKSELSHTHETEIEWEPSDERFESWNQSIDGFQSPLPTRQQQHEQQSFATLRYHDNDDINIDDDDNDNNDECTANLIDIPPLPSSSSSTTTGRRSKLTIDTSNPKSKRFHSLRRKISMMLYNIHDHDHDHDHSSEENDNSNGRGSGKDGQDDNLITKDNKQFLKRFLFSDQHSRQQDFITHSPSLNPLNDSTTTISEESHLIEEEDNESDDHKITDLMSPLTQSTVVTTTTTTTPTTTRSTHSDDHSTKSNWLTHWKRFDLNLKGFKRNHHQRSSSDGSSSNNNGEEIVDLSTLKPFKQTQF